MNFPAFLSRVSPSLHILLLFFVLAVPFNDAIAEPPSIGHSYTNNAPSEEPQKEAFSDKKRTKAYKKRIRFIEKVQQFLSKKTKRAAKERIEECDQILLNTGEELEGKVIEIGLKTIAYKKCGWPDGPTYKIERSKVSSIRYSNGTVETIAAEEYVAPAENQVRPHSGKADNAAIGAFALSVGSLALPFLAIPGLILSIRALRTANETGNMSSRGFAIAGLCISIVMLALLVFAVGFLILALAAI